MCIITATTATGATVEVENFVHPFEADRVLRWWEEHGMQNVIYKIKKVGYVRLFQ